MVGVRWAASRVSALLVAATLVGAAPALAQTPPAAPAPRCGGLLCDIGLLGGPVAGAPGSAPDATALPCHDFICRAFGGGRDEAVAPPPEQVAVEPTKPEKKVRHVKAKAKVKTAKADTPKPEPVEAKPSEPAAGGAR